MIIKIEKFDKVCCVLGFILGLLIISLNIIRPNVYLISIGVVLFFSSLIYLVYRDKFKYEKIDIPTKKHYSKIINIFYWLLISTILLINHYMVLYSRPFLIFILLTITVIVLGIEILINDVSQKLINTAIFKILLLSIIFRATGFFVSPYPIGSDPWAHAEYIKNFLSHGHIMVDKYPSGTGMANYYCSYPLTHLLACSLKLISNLSISNISFIIGTLLTLSTVFVYLIVHNITRDPKISLLAMLLINFVDYHIQWSIQVIAMSFGLALFTILIYLIIKKEKKPLVFTILIMVLLFDIIWTHTISAFIVAIFLLSIYIGLTWFKYLFNDSRLTKQTMVSLTVSILCIVLLLYHWMDPSYTFINGIVIGLKKALSSDVTFIANANPLEIGGLINNIGFITYFFFAIIGIYIGLKTINQKVYGLIIGCLSLISVMLLFMAFGLNNIVPSRWWSFTYIVIVIFTSIGLVYFINLFHKGYQKIIIVSFFLGISTFFMITNNISNVDSTLYTPCLKLSWSESEMALFDNMDKKYNGLIMADVQTAIRPFNTFFKRYSCEPYPYIEENGDLNLNEMKKGMVIWTHDSLYKKVQMFRDGSFEIMGSQFEDDLNNSFNCIQDNYRARSYLGLQVNR